MIATVDVARARFSRARAVACAALAGALLCAASARAQESAVREADRLFREGTAALDAGRHDEACAKLARSQKLDPALGTQFNLALCHQHSGRPALAYGLFAEVATAARAAGKAERERASREKMAALEPKIGRIALDTSAISAVPGAELKVAGAIVPRERWPEPQVVEPGRVPVEVAAPGRATWRAEVDARAGASVRLEAGVGRGAGAAASGAGVASGAPDAAAPGAGSGQRVLGAAVGGAGLVGVGVGAVFGILSMSRRGEASDVCPEPDPCGDRRAAQRWTDATAAGNVSTVAFIGGGVALAAGAVLWLTAPSPGTRAVRWAPHVGPRAAGVVLRGDFL
ncbi:hypothetical protein ACMHYB_15615 [Sorangium sp. So ce1128]